MYSKDWTLEDQIAVEKEIEDQMENDYDENYGYVRFRVPVVEDSGMMNIPWKIFVENMDGRKIRVGTAPPYWSMERIKELVLDGRYDNGLDPEQDIYCFYIEK